MPELPEVETICRGLSQRVTGLRVHSITVMRPSLRRPIDPELPVRLQGAAVTALARRGKYIVMRTNRDDSIFIHLGMSGRLVLSAPEVVCAPHTHVIFDFGDEGQVRFVDPRRFGAIDLVKTREETSWPVIASLGPEPLGAGFNVHDLGKSLSTRKTTIKAALLNQEIVAGLGNIYVCEILFRARVSPFARCLDLSAAALQRIIDETHVVLKAAIAAGGSTLRDYVGADGQPGAFATLHQVYDRAEEPCSQCASRGQKQLILRAVQSGRSSFYCPACQKET